MAKVVLSNLTKKFDEVVAVNNMNTTIKDREFVVLVGPSGCGKTTTLRIIAGLEEATEGEVYIDDRLVNNVPPKDRDIAMVFQNYALYPHMDVYNNMAFGLKLRKTPKAEIDKRVKNAAKILKIEELLKRRPKQLSGGQRQRVALARALCLEPQLLLLDEPTANLDSSQVESLESFLVELPQRGMSLVIASHDHGQSQRLGGKIIKLNHGKVVEKEETSPPAGNLKVV